MPEGGLDCPSCGAVVDPGDQFCGYCGGRMPAEASSEPPVPSPPPPRRAEPRPQPIRTPAEPTQQQGRVAPEATLDPGALPQEADPAREAPPELRPGFWARNGGIGLTFIRIALGFLFIFPRNPLMFGDPWAGGDPWSPGETGFYPLESVEYWAQTLVLTDRQELFYGVCLIQMLAGAFIVLGLLFRPACVLMATTFIGIWVVVFLFGSGIGIQLGYLAWALAFLGLMLAGPGRLALRRRRD